MLTFSRVLRWRFGIYLLFAILFFVWLGDILVAIIEDGQMSVGHGGHLRQSLMVTDASQTVVWQAEFTPFGAALPIIDTEDPGLRFPGQWAEGETGLLQNWHRDYDPSLGRYIEADPLGLDAGQSLYGYVGQDRTRRDRSGGVAMLWHGLL